MCSDLHIPFEKYPICQLNMYMETVNVSDEECMDATNLTNHRYQHKLYTEYHTDYTILYIRHKTLYTYIHTHTRIYEYTFT